MKSENEIFKLSIFSNDAINSRLSTRKGEVKLGEKLVSLEKAKYVVLGIKESIGPQANKGRSGAENGFEPFLNKFLNMQSNESLVGSNICVLGQIEIVNKYSSTKSKTEDVEELDNFVFNVLSSYLSKEQIPIIIGGGHNNAYPLIKYASIINNKKIEVVNLDAHADYRALEGRHSGNPFSYAYHDGFLDKYLVFGLHQRYNSQLILDDLRRDNHEMTFFEDYIDGRRDFYEDFRNYVKTSTMKKFLGVELDLDVLENMPSSAFSPVGISTKVARQYLRSMAEIKSIAYLHLPEGAPKNELEDMIVGKTLAFLVTDFLAIHGRLKE